MMGVLADDFGLPCQLGLTGFKWIAKMVKDMPEKNLIGGGEESFGFMVGDFVRDKDAVTASLLACEIAAQQKAKGETLLDYAIELYKKYGVYQEELISFVKPGKSGAEEIQAMMKSLRETPLKEIVGEAVVRIDDFQNSISTHPDGSQTAIDMPKSNVLIYWTAQGTKVAARPSGTEPKIKFYLSANAPWEGDYRKTQTALLNKMDRIAEQFNLR
jgi:phosphoglucomutase